MRTKMDYEVIIIGAGPAGISAALQLKRYDIRALLVEKDRIGGLLLNANRVENYPGFPEGISGPQLVELFQQQLEKYSISVLKAKLTALSHKNDHIEVSICKQQFSTKYLVIATGTKPQKIDYEIRVPPELQDKIYSEVYPLIGLKNNRFLIIGAGDAAFDYALNLADYNRVTICNCGTVIKALPPLARQAKININISYRENTRISELFTGKNGAVGVRCHCNGKTEEMVIDYLVFAIGREAQLDFLPESFMNIDNHSGVKRNVYFIGDVKNGAYRQVAIAAGDGIQAAMVIAAKLKGNGKK